MKADVRDGRHVGGHCDCDHPAGERVHAQALPRGCRHAAVELQWWDRRAGGRAGVSRVGGPGESEILALSPHSPAGTEGAHWERVQSDAKQLNKTATPPHAWPRSFLLQHSCRTHVARDVTQRLGASRREAREELGIGGCGNLLRGQVHVLDVARQCLQPRSTPRRVNWCSHASATCCMRTRQGHQREICACVSAMQPALPPGLLPNHGQ